MRASPTPAEPVPLNRGRTGMRYSACIEWLFAETGDFPDRIRAARAAGLEGVEFWQWSSKDLAVVAAALADTGMSLTGIIAEPMVALTDSTQRPAFIEGLRRSVDAASRLGCQALFVQAGADLTGRSREAQRDALVACLSAAADVLRGTGVTLLLEPLNTRVDHPGYFLPSTVGALDIIDDVGRREVRLLYDLYHSAMMGEEVEAVLGRRVDRVGHMHLADAPGRHEPGTGTLDWRRRLEWLVANGYEGWVGLEYLPTRPTRETLSFLSDRSLR
jgi:hydroxypyruvate isomerase